MKEKKNIKSIKTLAYLIGLVFLLLLAPCKVRNYIQVELGLPTTEVSNKSVSNFSDSNCKTFEIACKNLSLSKSFSQLISSLVENTKVFTFQTTDFTKKSILTYAKETKTISFVPLYILFKNFKAYL